MHEIGLKLIRGGNCLFAQGNTRDARQVKLNMPRSPGLFARSFSFVVFWKQLKQYKMLQGRKVAQFRYALDNEIVVKITT